jgi:hypothetical protein
MIQQANFQEAINLLQENLDNHLSAERDVAMWNFHLATISLCVGLDALHRRLSRLEERVGEIVPAAPLDPGTGESGA